MRKLRNSLKQKSSTDEFVGDLADLQTVAFACD
jgi:hypothetical protein